jgi:hypothetical protein
MNLIIFSSLLGNEKQSCLSFILSLFQVLRLVFLIPNELINAKVSDLVDSHDDWNWRLLCEWMPKTSSDPLHFFILHFVKVL